MARDASKPNISRSPLCRRKTYAADLPYLDALHSCTCISDHPVYANSLLATFVPSSPNQHETILTTVVLTSDSLNARTKFRNHERYNISNPMPPVLASLSREAFENGDEAGLAGPRSSQQYSVRLRCVT